MQKCLFLVCPTDCLERVINKTYNNNHYFYTSLGNSVQFNKENLEAIKKLVLKNKLKKIFFVLSNENNIISDAIEKQNFITTRGLNTLYSEIKKQKNNSKMCSFRGINQSILLSYYLNLKIKELKTKLEKVGVKSVKINGKIYHNLEHKFKNIYPDLICLKKYNFN
ncbi:hypothetical protein [uncultured Polaribacter sp.]|uniref:hypothetical protein n=1 Tax=uncultured Polaribacter sp. TaxID=174711 RepID=UPI002625B3FC|nr:hypothetical protein [uncultured Polaribacter sp.]